MNLKLPINSAISFNYFFCSGDNDDEWIKKKIKDVEYSEFKDVKEIGKRGFGVVNRVATNDGMQVALKSIIEKKTSKLEDDDIKKFVNEIKLVRMVGFHQYDIGNYIMVLEYANEGNLRDYLINEKMERFKEERFIRMEG
ncbi:uncharacterized protein OCT59_001109 [Rhizophagus irregularis]|uniref:uncharacterized protein n=1 Tax=Rhizophagus irregularis TaxID=588596 RepID=UPI001C1CE7C4|nr:hypothetical protein OCT59_001109 [Rhizophagus irregularis]CAB4485503.1 unnamed protein product [Rhizophagus irregularis]